jgi:phosphoserine phosphatase RsbU/P
VVVLLTDGLTESAAPDGTEFGAERVLQYIRTHREKTAQQLVEGLQQEARAFSANALQDDDITLVILKVNQKHTQ